MSIIKDIVTRIESWDPIEVIQDDIQAKELKRYSHIHSLWEKYSNLRVELTRAIYKEYERELDDE